MRRDVRWPPDARVDPTLPLADILALPVEQRPEIVLPRHPTVAQARAELGWLAKRFPYVLITGGDIIYNREIMQATRCGWAVAGSPPRFTTFGMAVDAQWTPAMMTQQLSLAGMMPGAQTRRVEQPYTPGLEPVIACEDSLLARGWRSAIASYRVNHVAVYARWHPDHCPVEQFARVADGALLPFGDTQSAKAALDHGLAVRWCSTVDIDQDLR